MIPGANTLGGQALAARADDGDLALALAIPVTVGFASQRVQVSTAVDIARLQRAVIGIRQTQYAVDVASALGV